MDLYQTLEVKWNKKEDGANEHNYAFGYETVAELDRKISSIFR
jgi:hypothetical protein